MALQDGSVWHRVVSISFGWTPALHSCLTVNSYSSLRVLAAAYAATDSDAAWLCEVLSTVIVYKTSDSFRRIVSWKGQRVREVLVLRTPFPFYCVLHHVHSERQHVLKLLTFCSQRFAIFRIWLRSLLLMHKHEAFSILYQETRKSHKPVVSASWCSGLLNDNWVLCAVLYILYNPPYDTVFVLNWAVVLKHKFRTFRILFVLEWAVIHIKESKSCEYF